METLSVAEARRLALVRAGLLRPELTGMPRRAPADTRASRAAAHAVIRRFGYLQLDTVSVSGARSHTLVLMSRLEGFDPAVGESLLAPGEPLFEYWGHEASWIPLELYPVFEFRRREFATHPWWGDLIGDDPDLARRLLERVAHEGPLRASELESRRGSGGGWWNVGKVKKMASALWSSGSLAVRERVGFQRTWDLAERVIPEPLRSMTVDLDESLRVLLLRALEGHGWATTGTLSATWRLHGLSRQVAAALCDLRDAGSVCECVVRTSNDRRVRGWVRTSDLELAASLARSRFRRDRGVLLSPFDPVLWDRSRVRLLFGFEQVLEIFKPASQRVYGYYCLPVLAGDALVARVDLRADRREGRLKVLASHLEPGRPRAEVRAATNAALVRHANALGLGLWNPHRAFLTTSHL